MNNNYSKYLSGIGLLLIGIGVFYYFVMFLPEKDKIKQEEEKTQQLLEKQIECMKLGKQEFEKIKNEKDEKISLYPSSTIEGKYNYNNLDETCYMDFTIITSLPDGNYFVYKAIIDVYANAVKAEVNYTNGNMDTEEIKKIRDKFDEQYDLLMSTRESLEEIFK